MPVKVYSSEADKLAADSLERIAAAAESIAQWLELIHNAMPRPSAIDDLGISVDGVRSAISALAEAAENDR